MDADTGKVLSYIVLSNVLGKRELHSASEVSEVRARSHWNALLNNSDLVRIRTFTTTEVLRKAWRARA
jgi:hypothetical protein